MDIKKDFKDSYKLLLQNKTLIVPRTIGFLLPLVLLVLFLLVSGLNPLVQEFVFHHENFNDMKKDYLTDLENVQESDYTWELINYLGRDFESSEYNDEFTAYLDEQGYDWTRYGDLITVDNILLLILFIILVVLGAVYFSCMSFMMIAMAIKKKRLNLSLVTGATNKMVLRYIGLNIVMFCLIFIPILIFGLILVPSFLISPIFGGILLFLGVIAFIIYLIFMILKLFLATPILFIENIGAIDSFKKSYHMTKGKMGNVFIIGIILYGIVIVMNNLVMNPMYTSFGGIIFNPSIATGLISFLVFAIFLVIQVAIIVFSNGFLFYAYIDLKGGK